MTRWSIVNGLRRRRRVLERRKDRLLDLILEDRIEPEEYDRRMGSLRNELAVAVAAANDETTGEAQIEAALGYAQLVYADPAKLWRTAPLPAKRALQELLFPGGVTQGPSGIRTAGRCPLLALCVPETARKPSGDPNGI